MHTNTSARLYNPDLAPVSKEARSWGWIPIFNVWANTAQSLLGYTLAASLFLSYGLNGWAVFAAILVSSLIILGLVNLAGRPSVKYGIPFPVTARAGMGVFGANFPAMIRGIVAIFWYGAQTYVASTAVSLALVALVGNGPPDKFLGLTLINWISLMFVSLFQVVLFWRGISTIRQFLNFAAPAVYLVMIVLLAMLWVRAGGDLWSEVGDIFKGSGGYKHGPVSAFLAVVGTMIAFYSPVIVNFGDFARYTFNEAQMKKGNRIGLLFNIAFFALIALFVTAGSAVVFGEKITDPTRMISMVDVPALTFVAAITFFIATVGINVVANFVPPANDISNLAPNKISFRSGGLVTATLAFIVSALWVSVISQIGIVRFVNTIGALLAPAYGILIFDYYLVKKQRLDVQQMYSDDPTGDYYYTKGWNLKALTAFVLAAIFSVLGVWLPALEFLSGFDWIIGALLAGSIYVALVRSGSGRSDVIARDPEKTEMPRTPVDP